MSFPPNYFVSKFLVEKGRLPTSNDNVELSEYCKRLRKEYYSIPNEEQTQQQKEFGILPTETEYTTLTKQEKCEFLIGYITTYDKIPTEYKNFYSIYYNICQKEIDKMAEYEKDLIEIIESHNLFPKKNKKRNAREEMKLSSTKKQKICQTISIDIEPEIIEPEINDFFKQNCQMIKMWRKEYEKLPIMLEDWFNSVKNDLLNGKLNAREYELLRSIL